MVITILMNLFSPGDFTIRFRSSNRLSRRGFQAYVICYDPMEANAEGQCEIYTDITLFIITRFLVECTEVGPDRKRRSVSWEEMAYQ